MSDVDASRYTGMHRWDLTTHTGDKIRSPRQMGLLSDLFHTKSVIQKLMLLKSNTAKARRITKPKAELTDVCSLGVTKETAGRKQRSDDVIDMGGRAIQRGGRHSEAQVRLDMWEQSG